MKKHKNSQEKPQHLKRKLMSALCMLLISTIVLGVTSYAWLVLSIAPEVTGMTANVGANGSLEIALLNSETREDLSKISSMGGSLASRDPSANNTWGNILDLSYTEYGLQEVVLWPARLNMIQSGDKYIVDSGLLAVPTYGYDGRIIELTDDTVSGTFDGNAFSTVIGTQDYGVRVVGTADSMSVQGSSLALAKSNIKTYMNSANKAAASAMDANGNDLLSILMDRTVTYDDDDLNVLKKMASNLQVSLNYIDLALRQGMIAVAASKIANEGTFNTAKNTIMDTSVKLSDVIAELQDKYEIPEGYTTWITAYETTQNNLTAAVNGFNALVGGSYTWAQFKEPLTYIMDMDKTFINETKFTEFDTSKAQELLKGDVVITLGTGSGVFADIADFTGDYESWLRYIVEIQIKTLTNKDPVYLQAMSDLVADMEPADGSDAENAAVELTSTYGYAVDMAFRTNAAVSNLLLQTTPTQRVYDDSDNARTMGGGSYMEFTTDDETFTLEKMLQLMDAVRVAFIDDQGTLLGIAKLNTSNRVVDGEKVQAPLYLYSFHIDEEDGSLQMDERQKVNNVLTSLEQNTAKAVSAVVWLDGDIVDNSMVSATEETSLNGTLNLQFASSANLVAGNNNSLMNITADKSGLEDAITEAKETYDAGKGTYTTSTWDVFATAYNNAVAVNDNPAATEYQIYMATLALKTAQPALTEVSLEALAEQIALYRDVVGTTDKLHALPYYDEESDTIINLGVYSEDESELTYTQEELDRAEKIYGVDYQRNFNDEGNGVLTQIYTDESWTALTAAVYAAEYVHVDPKATDDEIDAAITAMETAHDALERMVYYIPYDYEGVVYYMAISEETDTYGKWYDSEFKRVISDLTILQLDAKAEQIMDIGEIAQDYYIPNNSGFITPYVDFYNEVYTQLDVTIKALMWNLPKQFSLAISGEQISALNALVTWAETMEEPAEDDALYTEKLEHYKKAQGMIFSAEQVLDKGNTATYAEAEEMIQKFAAVKLDYEWFVEWNAMTEDEQKAYTEEHSTEYITADQITVLTKAVNAGKAVEGWDTEEDYKDLKAAIDAVDAALAAAADADYTKRTTEVQAIEVLNNLNEQLKKNGLEEVTAYNTLTFTVPVSEDTYEMVYSVQDNPMTGIVVNGDVGKATIEAVVLTESGVVFTMTKDIMVYSPAGGTEISYNAEYDTTVPMGGDIVQWEGVPSWTSYNAWDRIVQPGETLQFSTGLICRQEPKLDEYGNHDYIEHSKTATANGEEYTVTEKEYLYEDIAHTEKAVSYEWATSDPAIMAVVSAADGSCSLLAKSIGEVTVSVTVTTEQGNTYADSFTVYVHGATIQGESEMDIEETGSLTADVSLETHNEHVYSWTCDNETVIKLTEADKQTCQIEALDNGVATIMLTVKEQYEAQSAAGETVTVTVRTFTTQMTINVMKNPIETVTLNVGSYTIDIGNATDLNVTVEPVGEDYETVFEYEWLVDTEDIVKLTPNGEVCTVEGISEGSVTVTVKLYTERGRTITKNVTITVNDPNAVPST